jgi:hypothetical protein
VARQLVPQLPSEQSNAHCKHHNVLVQAIGAAQSAELAAERAAGGNDDDEADAGGGADRATTQRLRGAVLVNIAKLRANAARIYGLSSRSIAGAGDRSSWAREWRHLEADLLGMVAAGGAAEQARVAARVHRTYLAFRA